MSPQHEDRQVQQSAELNNLAAPPTIGEKVRKLVDALLEPDSANLQLEEIQRKLVNFLFSKDPTKNPQYEWDILNALPELFIGNEAVGAAIAASYILYPSEIPLGEEPATYALRAVNNTVPEATPYVLALMLMDKNGRDSLQLMLAADESLAKRVSDIGDMGENSVELTKYLRETVPLISTFLHINNSKTIDESYVRSLINVVSVDQAIKLASLIPDKGVQIACCALGVSMAVQHIAITKGTKEYNLNLEQAKERLSILEQLLSGQKKNLLLQLLEHN